MTQARVWGTLSHSPRPQVDTEAAEHVVAILNH